MLYFKAKVSDVKILIKIYNRIDFFRIVFDNLIKVCWHQWLMDFSEWMKVAIKTFNNI